MLCILFILLYYRCLFFWQVCSLQYIFYYALYSVNRDESQRRKLWDPSSEGDNSDGQLQVYQEFSCTAAVRGNGCNVEYALHLLHQCKGDITEAMLLLMGEPPSLPASHPMVGYKYQGNGWCSHFVY